jgi:hypothetical protein
MPVMSQYWRTVGRSWLRHTSATRQARMPSKLTNSSRVASVEATYRQRKLA